MRIFQSLLLLIHLSTQFSVAQTVQTAAFAYEGSGQTRQQDIDVPVGQVFKLLSWTTGGVGPYSLKVDGIQVQVAPARASTTVPIFSPSFVVAGPRTVSLVVGPNDSLVCSYILETNGQVATQNVASQVVVIPHNGSSPADIILESSADLITWTAAPAGSYPTSTEKRFFRVRLVTQP